MPEYIDREAAIKQLDGLLEKDTGGVFGFFAETRRVLCELPAAHVVPVRHGRWLDKTMKIKGAHGLAYGRFGCSVCKEKQSRKTLYCPNCGAKMDKEV